MLRDMITLYPAHGLLESTHGLCYVFNLEEDSATWAFLLDLMYPTPPAEGISWVSTHS